MANIRDITALKDALMAITFEDENGRDVAFVQYRADTMTLDGLKVYVPQPDDPTIEISIDTDLLEQLEQWSRKRGLTVEQMIRAFLIYIVDNLYAKWKRDGYAKIPWKNEDGTGDTAMHNENTPAEAQNSNPGKPAMLLSTEAPDIETILQKIPRITRQEFFDNMDEILDRVSNEKTALIIQEAGKKELLLCSLEWFVLDQAAMDI